MDLFFDTSEFSHTGINVLELVLKFLNFGLTKRLVAVQHVSCLFGLSICSLGRGTGLLKTALVSAQVKLFTAESLLNFVNWVLCLGVKCL